MTSKLTIEEAEFSYLDVGHGPAIVLIHGWTGDSGDWTYQVPALLESGYRVIAPDLRGHGASSVTDAGYDVASQAADVMRLVDHLSIEQVAIVGHSFGAAVAMTFADEYPDRCGATVLVDGAYGRERAAVEAMAGVLLPAMASPLCAQAVIQMVEQLHGPAPQKGLVEWHRRRALNIPDRVSQRIVHSLIGTESIFGRAVAEQILDRLKGPVFVLRGGESADQCGWERESLRHEKSEIGCWPEAGHWLHQEQSTRFNQLLLPWLRTTWPSDT